MPRTIPEPVPAHAPLPDLPTQVHTGLAFAYELREAAAHRLQQVWERTARRHALQQWARAAQVHAAYALAAMQLAHREVLGPPPAPAGDKGVSYD